MTPNPNLNIRQLGSRLYPELPGGEDPDKAREREISPSRYRSVEMPSVMGGTYFKPILDGKP